jgi:hypothetical protein
LEIPFIMRILLELPPREAQMQSEERHRCSQVWPGLAHWTLKPVMPNQQLTLKVVEKDWKDHGKP